MFDFEQLLKMDGRAVRARAERSQGREGKFQYGLPLPIGVLINTRWEWQETGVKTKPAAEARKGVCVSVLLDAAAARLEEEAQKILAKAAKLREMATEANS